MKKIVAALLTPPSCRPLFACTVLTLFLSVLDRDSQVEKVCGSFSVVHILNAHTHTHHELHVTDGAAGPRPCSACPCPSASLSTRYPPQCPCQSEIQPTSPLRCAPTNLLREITYLFCSLDCCCRICINSCSSQQSHGTLEKIDMPRKRAAGTARVALTRRQNSNVAPHKPLVVSLRHRPRTRSRPARGPTESTNVAVVEGPVDAEDETTKVVAVQLECRRAQRTRR